MTAAAGETTIAATMGDQSAVGTVKMAEVTEAAAVAAATVVEESVGTAAAEMGTTGRPRRLRRAAAALGETGAGSRGATQMALAVEMTTSGSLPLTWLSSGGRSG